MIYLGNNLIPMMSWGLFPFYLSTMSISFSSVVVSFGISAGNILHSLICVYFKSGAVLAIIHHFYH